MSCLESNRIEMISREFPINEYKRVLSFRSNISTVPSISPFDWKEIRITTSEEIRFFIQTQTRDARIGLETKQLFFCLPIDHSKKMID